MKTLILTLAIFSSIFTFCQNLRSQEEVKAFNKEFIRLINIERKKLNLDTLIEYYELNINSMEWSKECITRSSIKHSDISKSIASAECLHYSTGLISNIKDDAVYAIESLKESSAHWKILMSSDYHKIGLGEYVNYSKISQLYENSNKPVISTIVTVQLF